MQLNEPALFILAEVSVTLAAFSGVVVAFRLRGAQAWSPYELRILWLLLTDSFLVMLFALIPIPASLAGWSDDAIWGVFSALLGTYFIVGGVLALRGEVRDRAARKLFRVPVITPLFYYIVFPVAFAMGIALWLSVGNVVVPRGQAVYVLGLITLLAFAALEFLFFIGIVSREAQEA
jgi:hypothetical protein